MGGEGVDFPAPARAGLLPDTSPEVTLLWGWYHYWACSELLRHFLLELLQALPPRQFSRDLLREA